MVTMNTAELTKALHNRYDDNAFEYAFLEQVGNATGMSCNRHADAIAVSLWQSRGLTITGFEIKSSRQDWTHELKHPEKADDIASYCHYWYLVLGDENITQFGEVPSNWGVMIPKDKDNLKIIKQAVLNKKAKKIDMPFLCAILRKAQKQIIEPAKLEAKYNEGYKEGIKDEKANNEFTVKHKTEELSELKQIVRTFEDTVGFKITYTPFKPEEVGKAVNDVLSGAYKRELKNLKRLHERAQEIVKDIDEAIKQEESSENHDPTDIFSVESLEK